MKINLESIEERLKIVDLPSEIKLDKATTIVDVKKFFDSHIAMMRSPVASERTKKLFEDRIIVAGLAVKKHNEKK